MEFCRFFRSVKFVVRSQFLRLRRLCSDDTDFNNKYRKRPCISRTFFHKTEAKNRGCGLSMDTSMFGVLKNLLNIHKTS